MGRIASTWDGAALSKKSRDINYWLRIIFVIVLGMLAARWLSGFDWWREVTYRTYGILLRASQSPPRFVQNTALVLIDDDDYWTADSEWERRTPLRRDTLAKLIAQVAKASPSAIAIDIDLRAQRPDGRVLTHSRYDDETKVLFDTIVEVSKKTPIVLPRTVSLDERSSEPVLDADLFDSILGGKVGAGFTRLPADVRNLALSTAVGKRRVDSLAAAAARFVTRESIEAADERDGDDLPFSMFLDPRLFAKRTASARDVLAGKPQALAKLLGKAVVIGGAWHREAYGRGEVVDRHLTPVGMMPGAMIHANYIEALLGQRSFRPAYHWVHYVIDVLVGIALAAIFVAARGAWTIVYLAVLGVIVALLSVIAFQNLGTFFDGVPALILLGAHAAFETVSEWKEAYDEHRHCVREAEA
ncbi:MAG TPA: CHASE2 domain-containing protein [Thermoanaerobaculia bacterium]